jgi:hypothetical protein
MDDNGGAEDGVSLEADSKAKAIQFAQKKH